MINNAYVHWNEEESNVHVNINIDKPVQIKAEMCDGTGKCVANVFEKLCKQGEVNAVKKIKDIAKGLYVMKFSSNEGQNVIRFKVH